MVGGDEGDENDPTVGGDDSNAEAAAGTGSGSAISAGASTGPASAGPVAGSAATAGTNAGGQAAPGPSRIDQAYDAITLALQGTDMDPEVCAHSLVSSSTILNVCSPPYCLDCAHLSIPLMGRKNGTPPTKLDQQVPTKIVLHFSSVPSLSSHFLIHRPIFLSPHR